MGCGMMTLNTGLVSHSLTSKATPFRLSIGKQCTLPSRETAGSLEIGSSSKAITSTGRWASHFRSRAFFSCGYRF